MLSIYVYQFPISIVHSVLHGSIPLGTNKEQGNTYFAELAASRLLIIILLASMSVLFLIILGTARQ